MPEKIDRYWRYHLILDYGAVDPTYGRVTGIKALGVYPNPFGDPTPPTSWLATWTSWGTEAWENKAFGYAANTGNSLFLPGRIGQVGNAVFDYDPSQTQVFLVHIVTATNSFWARPQVCGEDGGGGIVPEPSGLSVLGAAILPMLGLKARRRRNR